jgi:hypothetical protein
MIIVDRKVNAHSTIMDFRICIRFFDLVETIDYRCEDRKKVGVSRDINGTI